MMISRRADSRREATRSRMPSRSLIMIGSEGGFAAGLFSRNDVIGTPLQSIEARSGLTRRWADCPTCRRPERPLRRLLPAQFVRLRDGVADVARGRKREQALAGFRGDG